MSMITLPSLQSIKTELARRNVLHFTRYTFTSFRESWHHVVLASFLTRFALGLIPRGMIFMPPRHGKTEFSSRRMPPFIFGKNPDAHIIGCSYGQDLAGDISNDVQRIMNSPEYADVFDTRIGGKGGKETERMFTIANARGYYRAAGIGGPIGGYGFSYGLIDDPIKNSEEAESDVYRDKIWNWYQSTFYTRQETPGSILITTTRWHEDDLAGRLLRKAKQEGGDQWEVLNLPAIALPELKNPDDIDHADAWKHKHPDDPRAEGDALWPEFFPLTRPDGEIGPSLMAQKNTLGTAWFQALYQGNPVPPGGQMFKREWFRIVSPANVPRDGMIWCRFWDCAGSEDKGDYTVGVKMGYHYQTKTIWIVHVVRGRWTSGKVDDVILQTAKADGTGVRIREEREPGSAGLAVINARKKTLFGYDYAGRPATGEKTLRWRPYSAQVEGLNVFLVEGPWNLEFIDEHVLAPKGTHDDQIDGASGAFNELVLGPGNVHVVKLKGFH